MEKLSKMGMIYSESASNRGFYAQADKSWQRLFTSHGMRPLFALLLTIFLAGCSAPTRITGSWFNPSHSGRKVQHLYVAALTSNAVARSVAEEEMAIALKDYNVKVTKSLSHFPAATTDGDSITLQKIMENLKHDGEDAILTITLIKQKSELRYVPGSYVYDPANRFFFYGRFSGYYSYWNPYMYDPGYYAEDEVYFIESNLYDVKTDELIWSAQSKTYNPSGFHPFSKEFAETIAAKMEKDKLITKR